MTMNKIISSTSIALTMAIVLGAGGISFVQAQTGLGVGVSASATVNAGGVGITANGQVSARIADLIARAKARGDEEITRRLNALNALIARVNAMQKLSSDEKTSLSTTIEAQITAMNDLETQINADAASDSTSSLRADIKSITGSYRIFALIIPVGALEAAADRVMTVASDFNDVATQLQARITAAQSAGNNVTISQSAMADFNTKVSDANTQAQAAVTEVAGLKPDNGDQTQFQANLTAMKDARSKIQAAQQDLVAARKDAATIVKQLRGFEKASASVSASSTASSTTTSQ